MKKNVPIILKTFDKIFLNMPTICHSPQIILFHPTGTQLRNTALGVGDITEQLGPPGALPKTQAWSSVWQLTHVCL